MLQLQQEKEEIVAKPWSWVIATAGEGGGREREIEMVLLSIDNTREAKAVVSYS